MNGPLSALHSVTDGILTVDLESRIVYMNPAAERMTGWRLQDAAGKPSAAVFRVVNAITREEDWQPLRAVMQDAEGYSLLPHSLLVQRNGTETPVEDSISPIFDGDGKVCGAAVVFRDIGYSRLVLLKALHRANHDCLTTLPNRASLIERLKQTLSKPSESSFEALLYLDLDHFKEINDTFGHSAGDFVLQVVAKRISSSMRKNDLVCRFGGDEFVALITNLDDKEPLLRIVGSLLKCAAEPILLEGKTIRTSMSIGISLWGSTCQSAEELIQDADSAMYAAKRFGGNGVRWFTPEMRLSLRTQTDLEGELQAALDEERFTLCYQPQVDIASGRIVGAEALLRLRSATGELLTPSSFLPMAERTGQIVPIGQMVLRNVLKQQRSWRDAGFVLRIAVNVSPCELLHPEFRATFARILTEENFSEGSILLEFTEAGSLHSAPHREMLASLKAEGVDLAIDDFGTGHSNLDYLRHFPIDVIKIDRQFLQNTSSGSQDTLLLRAIIDMAQSLQRTVIAEGVESDEQLAFLRASRCDQAQGFLFAPAVTPAELYSRWASAT